MKALTVFLGTALVGAIAALLLAPQKGEDTREAVRRFIKQRCCRADDKSIDDLVEAIVVELEKSK